MAGSDIVPIVEVTSIVLFQSTASVAINDIYQDYSGRHLLELLRNMFNEHFDISIYESANSKSWTDIQKYIKVENIIKW